eukprot:COSAG02_NODE_3506_length_6636_cov_14.560808_4_plen_98_part_00
MWNIFDKNWAQEIDQSWPLRDDYGDVDKSTLKRAPPDKKDVRLPVFAALKIGTMQRNIEFLLTHAFVMMLTVVDLCSLCDVLVAVLACSFTVRFDYG